MRIGIVGAGASGIMAAIIAAENGADVTLIERKNKIGKKILATGNGKCNFTNKKLGTSDYNSQYNKEIGNYFSQFDQNDLISLFEDWGMLIKDRDGYCYPRSEQASTVLALLEQKIFLNKVTILTETFPEEVILSKEGFILKLNNNKRLYFDKLILATGSYAGERNRDIYSGYSYAEKMGHSIIPIVPALVQVKAVGKEFKTVAGVRCPAALTLYINDNFICREEGELQLTDYGISGFPVFQLSRHVAYGAYYKKKMLITVDFLPEINKEEWEKLLFKKWSSFSKELTLEDFFMGYLNRKINYMIITSLGYKAETSLSKLKLKDLHFIGKKMKNWTVLPEDTKAYESAQICAGGVSLEEITEKMESKLIKNLYFCGEIVDVDGRCGGYNLQWAWTSGYLAGKYASSKKKKEKDKK